MKKIKLCISKHLKYVLLLLPPQLLISVEYMSLQESNNKKKKKYLSPYLEPLPEPVQPWTETRKIKLHNAAVKLQRMQEQNSAMNEKLTLNTAVNNLRKIIIFFIKIIFYEDNTFLKKV